MDLEGLITAVGISATLLTAIATYVNARSEAKKREADVSRNEAESNNLSPIIIAERFGQISLSLSEELGAQLKDCIDRQKDLAKTVAELKTENEKLRLAIITVVGSIRTLSERHAQLPKEEREACAIFDIMDKYLAQLLKTLTKIIQENPDV